MYKQMIVNEERSRTAAVGSWLLALGRNCNPPNSVPSPIDCGELLGAPDL